MKISKSKVVASTSSLKIPAPFNKYYKLVSDAEIEDYTGVPARPTPCEEADGYDIKSYSYVIAKPEYEDALANNGIDIAELITSGWDSNKLQVAMVVGDRIVPISISEIENCIGDDLYDRDTVMQAIKDEFAIDDYDAYSIYDWYAAEDAFSDFSSIEDFLDYVHDDIYDMLDACDDQVQADRIREAIEGSTKVSKKSVKGSIDTGMQYWYLTKHGLGPGMMPNDVHVMDVIDDGWDTYILLDKLLTTEELNYYDIKEKTPPANLMASTNVQADDFKGKVKKVAEDKDSIHYVVGSDDDPDWIVDFDIPDDPGYLAREEKRRLDRELADEEDYYDRLHGEGEYEGYPHDVYGSDEVEDDPESEEEDFLNQPNQEFKSDKTAVNGKQGKLPAVFRKASIPNGALVLDYGGGTPESEAVAQAYLDQFDATEMIYDPFNQTAEHNRNVVKELRANGGADVAVCSNVLNVIKEQDVRLDLLNKIKKLLKTGATAYISVYEGSGGGQGSATQNNESFQNNMKLGGYLEEVQQVFPEATKKGSVIIAPNTGSGNREPIQSSTDITTIDIDQLKQDIASGCEEYLTSPEGGYLPSGSPKSDKWDMTADEIYFIDIDEKLSEGMIRVEVRAELSYNGMINMSEILDKIIEKYDSDAYFDMVCPGIMEAYICDNSILLGSTVIEGGDYDRWNDEKLAEHDYSTVNPPEEEEFDDVDDRDNLNVDFDIDMYIIVNEDGTWIESEEDENNSDEISTDEMGILDPSQVEDDMVDLLMWDIPTIPGKYHVTGSVHLNYKPITDYFGNPTYECKMKYSNISDVEVTPAGKVDVDTEVETEPVESSTQVVEAGMTDKDVEYAILNNKPFELDAFKRYLGEDNTNEIKAEQLEVGDVFRVSTADIVDYGTVLKVVGINEPEVSDDYFDYTFRCEVVEPANERSSSKVGDEQVLWFDADEYVGEIIPV